MRAGEDISQDAINLLFVGDVFGRPGREALDRHLHGLKEKHRVDVCIANGENSAGGKGLTYDVAQQLYHSGVDVITLGNHAWDNRSVFSFIENDSRVVRPANFPPGTPGRGFTTLKVNGVTVVVAQLLCRLFMNAVDCPFRKADEILERLNGNPDHSERIVFLDLHGESTSEKMAMGWHLDGRVSAVIGTHTHIPTADERILPGGTAYLTDAGMSGAQDSVIGMDVQTAVLNFTTGIRQPFRIARENVKINAVLISVNRRNGKAVSIRRIQLNDDSSLSGDLD